jgi:hypothetical protein
LKVFKKKNFGTTFGGCSKKILFFLKKIFIFGWRQGVVERNGGRRL